MSELMLVNPKRKRSRRRRKMTAKQLKYFGPRKRRTKRRRTALAATPRRRHRRRSRTIAVANPRRRSHRRRRHVTRLRRNPSFSMGGFSTRRFLNDTLIPAGVGASGALGVDLALGYFGAQLPASLQSGLPNVAVKIAGAIGIGMLAGMLAGKRFGEQATAGAITVTLYDLLKKQIMSAMPALPLHGFSDMGWISPALQVGPGGGFAAYVGSDASYGMHGVGTYVSESDADYY